MIYRIYIRYTCYLYVIFTLYMLYDCNCDIRPANIHSLFVYVLNILYDMLGALFVVYDVMEEDMNEAYGTIRYSVMSCSDIVSIIKWPEHSDIQFYFMYNC